MHKLEFSKSEKVIDYLRSISSEEYREISCWVKNEGNYNIYIFSVLIKTEEQLKEIWEDITSDVASYLQTELTKDIEIWNIYIVFICPENISKELKDLVEQNKFSSRKLVLDSINVTTDIEIKQVLIDKLLDIQIERGTQDNGREQKEESYIELIQKHNIKLYGLISQGSEDIFESYLEELKNE